MAKEPAYNRWNTPGPFMQDQDLTEEQIEQSDLKMKAFKLADEGDFRLGVELGLFPKSRLEENKTSN